MRNSASRGSPGKWISCIHRAKAALLDAAFAPLGLGHGTYPFLTALYHQDGIRQEDLAAELHVDKITTARAVAKLVRAGYARRTSDSIDRRARRVHLTPQALEIETQVFAILKKSTGILTKDLTEREKQMALSLLKRMHANLIEHRKGHGRQ